jgi:hypothetical protein
LQPFGIDGAVWRTRCGWRPDRRSLNCHQGLNDEHIEVLVRQMMRWVKIEAPAMATSRTSFAHELRGPPSRSSQHQVPAICTGSIPVDFPVSSQGHGGLRWQPASYQAHDDKTNVREAQLASIQVIG